MKRFTPDRLLADYSSFAGNSLRSVGKVRTRPRACTGVNRATRLDGLRAFEPVRLEV